MKNLMIIKRIHQRLIRFGMVFLIGCIALVFLSCNNSKTDFTKREQNFDSGWKFKLGNVAHADSFVFTWNQTYG